MTIAYVLVQCTIGHEMDVLRNLLNLDLVKEAKGTFGYYDILVKISGKSQMEIDRIIIKKIRKIKNVTTTTTLSVIPEQEKN
jgi:DNA-binding Lrp family transcriptional regulator